MNFILRYRGRLPGKEKAGPRDKQAIRSYLSPQLAELCRREPSLADAISPDLPIVPFGKGRMQVAPWPPVFSKHYGISMAGFQFAPILHRPGNLVCQVDITWLRREVAGDILHGGDLDNRLKTLFDGLRMPHEESQIGGVKPSQEGERCYCLLEDDSQITRLSISTYQLLEPKLEGERDQDVDLLIHVNVLSTSRLSATLFGVPVASA